MSVPFFALVPRTITESPGWTPFKLVETVLVTLALAPLAALCGAVVWALAWAIARISSVGSLAGAAAALLVAGATANRQVLVAVAAIVCIVAVRHRSNVRRLLSHEER